MKIFFNLTLTLVICLTLVSVALPALAATTLQGEIRGEVEIIGTEGFDQTAAPNLTGTIGGIIRTILGLLGVILVVIVVYAGFLWMTAGGDPEQVKKSKAWLTNAIIGLIIILAAYAITDFVILKVFEATN